MAEWNLEMVYRRFRHPGESPVLAETHLYVMVCEAEADCTLRKLS